jgi:hypothetical protein
MLRATLGVETLDTRITPAKAGQANFGNLIAALNNIAVQVDRVNVLSDIQAGQVQVVNVQDVLNGNNVQALNNVLQNADIDVLTGSEFLNNNQVVQDVLNDADIAVTDVIAVNVLSGGDVVIFA